VAKFSTQSQAEKRAARRRLLGLANQIARVLHVKRANKILFPAIADALGKGGQGGIGKARGYVLVEEFAAKRGIEYQPGASRPKRQQVQLPAVATNDFLSTFEWRKLRMVALKKYGARCQACGASPKDGVTQLNVDHIKPRKLFPELALDENNLQVLCDACNHGKGNWDQTDWRVS
jgi:hypothetical protein